MRVPLHVEEAWLDVTSVAEEFTGPVLGSSASDVPLVAKAATYPDGFYLRRITLRVVTTSKKAINACVHFRLHSCWDRIHWLHSDKVVYREALLTTNIHGLKLDRMQQEAVGLFIGLLRGPLGCSPFGDAQI
jgi:hypothetical protein